MLTVAIVGRPNVGKTTLFNRLLGKVISIVHNSPGVTRDAKWSIADMYGMSAKIFDTPGIIKDGIKSQINTAMFECGVDKISEADAIILMLDASSELSGEDKFVINIVRKANKPCVIALNKSDISVSKMDELEFLSLGIGSVAVSISAEHNTGIYELCNALKDVCSNAGLSIDYSYQKRDYFKEKKKIKERELRDINVAIVGVPNVGKSTLMNKIVGYNRMIVSNQAGTTRDSVAEYLSHNGVTIKLFDTAGIRDKAKLIDSIEKMSVSEAQHSIDFAHVVVLLLDINSVLDTQNLILAKNVVKNGRALLVAVNKWDRIEKKEINRTLENLKSDIQSVSNDIVISNFITLSALYDKDVNPLLDSIIDAHRMWSTKISTTKLNDWLHLFKNNDGAFIFTNGKIKIKFINQIMIAPPTFAISINTLNFPQHHLTCIRKSLSKYFNLYNMPVRIMLKKYERGITKNITRKYVR